MVNRVGLKPVERSFDPTLSVHVWSAKPLIDRPKMLVMIEILLSSLDGASVFLIEVAAFRSLEPDVAPNADTCEIDWRVVIQACSH